MPCRALFGKAASVVASFESVSLNAQVARLPASNVDIRRTLFSRRFRCLRTALWVQPCRC